MVDSRRPWFQPIDLDPDPRNTQYRGKQQVDFRRCLVATVVLPAILTSHSRRPATVAKLMRAAYVSTGYERKA